MDDFEEEQIVFNEEGEDIRTGKASVLKWLSNLKKKNIDFLNARKDVTSIKVAPSDEFPQRRGYGDMDILDSFKSRTNLGVSKFDQEMSGVNENTDKIVPKITKESLLDGMPDRVRNIKTGAENLQKEEEKYQVNSSISKNSEDVSMEIDQTPLPKEESGVISNQQEDSDIWVDEKDEMSIKPSQLEQPNFSHKSPSINEISKDALNERLSYPHIENFDENFEPESLMITNRQDNVG